MKAYEFPSTVTEDGKLDIPIEIADALPRGKPVRLILLVSETIEEELEWQRFTAGQFLAGYSEADAIYDTVA